jgi:nicotinamidase-related amidase
MLVVVDMQKAFYTSGAILEDVLEEVKATMKKREWIVFLQYKGNGKTIVSLRNLVKDYPRKAFVTKSHDDGSYWLFARIEQLNLRPRKFRVCGVNTNACVKRTVFGLAMRSDIPIEVMKNLCNAKNEDWHNTGLHYMKKLKGVKVK